MRMRIRFSSLLSFSVALSAGLSARSGLADPVAATAPGADGCKPPRDPGNGHPTAATLALSYAECEASLDPHAAATAIAPLLRANSDKDDRARAEYLLAALRPKLFWLSVEVDVPGATIAVDGANVGTSPLADPLFLVPGHHALTASVPGLGVLRREVAGAAGDANGIVLRFAPEVSDEVVVAGDGGHRKRSVPLVVTGGALGLAGVGTGVALTIVAVARANAVTSDRDAIEGATSAPSPCAAPSAPVASRCAKLHADLASRDTWANAALVAYGIGAAAIGATLAYIFWPEPSGSSRTMFAFRPAPLIAPSAGGVWLEGLF
jgi:hypothetical protein